MLDLEALPNLICRELSPGCLFYVGQLPMELLWDQPTFEAVWRMHPEDKHLIMIHGREVVTPRWQQAYGADYLYTGRKNSALSTPLLLLPLLIWIQRVVSKRLNGLLLNWYEGASHYIGPHHDSTKFLVPGLPIVTISFGETRIFRLTLEKHVPKVVHDFPAPPGTVFVMPFGTNEVWKHAVPKSARYQGKRISVTFRAFTQGLVPS